MLRKQIGETARRARRSCAQIAAEERALKLQKEELESNERLLAQGYVQKTRIMTLQRAVAEYEARHGEHRAELAEVAPAHLRARAPHPLDAQHLRAGARPTS